MDCIYKVFRLVQGRLLLSKKLGSQYELLPFGASCDLIAKMYNTSTLWSNKFTVANFFLAHLSTKCSW